MVPVVGVEPTIPCGRLILSQLRMPVPPHRLEKLKYCSKYALMGKEHGGQPITTTSESTHQPPG